MRFHLDFRNSDSGRLTVAFLFSLVLHALLLIYVRFVQPSWQNAASKTSVLHVTLKPQVAETTPPPGIPEASRQSEGSAKVGVEAAAPIPAAVPEATPTQAAVTLTPKKKPRKKKLRKAPRKKKVLAVKQPAPFVVPEAATETKETTQPSPGTTPEPEAKQAESPPPMPSVENAAAKAPPPPEAPQQVVAVAPTPAPVEAPTPPKVEEPAPAKVEAPVPPKVEEPVAPKVEEPVPPKVEEPVPPKVEEPVPPKVEEPVPPKVEEPAPPKVEEAAPPKIEEPAPPKVEEPAPVTAEPSVTPRPSPFAGGKPEGAPTPSPGYAVPRRNIFGYGGLGRIPRIQQKPMMFGERRRIVDSKEQELRYLMYKESVVLKLQRIGQFNYPAEAARKNLSGNLLLEFSIRPDGSVEGINILRPSPHESLNEGAVKIIKICAPFSPFPDDIRKETDIMTIRINWNFTQSRQSLY